MRVVGGTLRGRKLSTFKGRSIRPTTDRVREAVFNIISKYAPFEKVADLYAGTGAMGIEALSRGALEVVFIDIDPAAYAVVKKNITALGLKDRSKVLQINAVDYLNKATGANQNDGFDLIFIDPPYDGGLYKTTIVAISHASRLRPGGIIVIETSKRKPLTESFAGLKLLDERKYGDSLIYIYTNESSE